MNKNKAVFLDRDGTINVEKNYLYKIDDFEFLPGVIDALRFFQERGYLLIIVTNQSGIARGYYTEEAYIELTNWMKIALAEQDVHIDAVYYCPHHPNGKVAKYSVDCECRKPKLGMYMKAQQDFLLDITKCIAIGDKIRDCEICKIFGCRGFLIGENESMDIINAVKEGAYKNISYAPTLLDCVKKLK